MQNSNTCVATTPEKESPSSPLTPQSSNNDTAEPSGKRVALFALHAAKL